MSHFSIPSHILIGKDALSEAVPYFQSYGEKAFIVTGPHVAKSPMMTDLKKTLAKAGIDYFVFNGITGEPTTEMIDEGLDEYKNSESQFLIGMGGGSPLDAAKAIGAMSVNDGCVTDYIGKEIAGDIPPIVAIPTTSGTGSEATKFTVITDNDKNTKMLLKGEVLIPRLAIVNADFTLDMPKSVTTATGMDALTHAIEAYTSQKAFALTDTYAISAVRRIMHYLPRVCQNGYDIRAREEMSLAALEAGICINNSSVTLVHGMSRPIGALFHVPHGLSNAMLLKECLSFALDGAYERFARLGREISVASETDSDADAAMKFLEAVGELCRICEIPTLRRYGIEENAFFHSVSKMAEDAIASGSPANTRKTVTEQNCIEIYHRVWK